MKTLGALMIAGFLSLSTLAWGSWVQDGGSLNKNPANDAAYPGIAVYNGTPFVCWQENTGENRIYVNYLNGSTWESLGDSLNANANRRAMMSDVFVYNGTPCVAWAETNGTAYTIITKAWTGSNWSQLGGMINENNLQHAWYPDLDFTNNTPYIAWTETNGTAFLGYVKRLNGSLWQSVGASFNVDINENAVWPSLAFNSNTPFVAWKENTSGATQTYVKHWNGSNWELLGGSLNIYATEDSKDPCLRFNNGTPYVVFAQSDGVKHQIYVRYWIPSQWNSLGGPLNIDPVQDAGYPDMVFHENTPYVIWNESNGVAKQIVVKVWQNSVWTQVGSSLNVEPSDDGVLAKLAASDTRIYATWYEESLPAQVHAKYYVIPPTATPSSTLTHTATPTPSLAVTSTPTNTLTSTWTTSPTSTPTSMLTSTPTSALSTLTSTPSSTPTSVLTSTSTSGVAFLWEQGVAIPNPFLPTRGQKASFNLSSGERLHSTIRIWDVPGRLVRTLTDTSEWDGKNDSGQLCEGGLYIFQIQTQERTYMGKVILIK